MIQRIQTVYLVLAILCLLSAIAFAISTFSGGHVLSITPLKITHADGSVAYTGFAGFPMALLYFAATGLLLYTISQFKNRKKQLALGRFNYLLLIVTILINYFGSQQVANDLAEVSYGAAFYLPVAALTLLFLANRSIKRDEDLIRSIDRLR